MLSTTVNEAFFDAKQKIWNGSEVNSVFDKNVSLGQVTLFVLERNPHKVIQIFDPTDERLTCQNLAEFGIRLAQHFKTKFGLKQEDVIGIMASNTTYIAPIALAAFLIGAAINPIHHSLDRKIVKDIFGLTRPKIIFSDEEAYTVVSKGLDDIGWKCAIYTVKGHIDGVPNVRELLRETIPYSSFVPEVLQNGGDQCAAIICSSGTTGLPKGVCISHRNLLCKCANDVTFPKFDDVLLTFSTLYWISGLLFMVRSFVGGVLRVITDQTFSPELFLELIEKYKVTQIIGPPSHAALTVEFSNKVQQNNSSIRTYICGGSPISVALSKKIIKWLGCERLCEAYGLSELGGLATLNKWPQRKQGSVGRLMADTRAKIISREGKLLGIGETGEILLWSPFKWNGYYGRPEMTRLIVDSDGWIRSGDLGYFDEDGFLFISGRQKDILKYRNFQISPIEIEDLIHTIPGVIDVCVFGIPDDIACDLPAAAVVTSPGCTLTEEDVCKIVASSLSEAKHLHGGAYFMDELPKTPSGKILRRELLSIVTARRGIN